MAENNQQNYGQVPPQQQQYAQQPGQQGQPYQNNQIQQPPYQQQYPQQMPQDNSVKQNDINLDQKIPVGQNQNAVKGDNIQPGFWNEYDASNFDLSDQKCRADFIKKVLCILTSQLGVAVFLCFIACASKGYREFQYQNAWLLTICCLIQIGCMITLYCFRKTAKQVPKNYILLGVYTVTQSYNMSYLCGQTDPGIVFLAACITVGLCTSLTIYAVKTKTDITQKIAFFMYAPFCLLALIIVGIIFPSYFMNCLIAIIIIIFFAAFLVFDIQRLTGGKTYSYDWDDYIIAALDIYIDIVMIFQYIMMLLRGR